MADLLSSLPAPIQRYAIASDNKKEQASSQQVREPPPYGKRQGWVPRTQEDFGGGGAFPEIHVAQFPLDMGRPGRSSTAIVAVTVDNEGQAKFDAIVRQGRPDQVIHTSFSDLVEKDASKVIKPRPDQEAEATEAARTKAALEGIVSHKLSAARPGNVPASAVSRPEDARIIRYTPDESAPGFNPAARTRIIKLVEAAVDPLEPPKFKHKKVPSGPPDAPVPVMHSPPRKVSVADQAAWKVPVCVSNWKTNRGYVVPLDKRVAAEGRGLVEPTINDSFAKLSEALTIAERKARVEVETRATIQRKLALRGKEEKESELRSLAARARLERTGVATHIPFPVNARPSGQEEVEEDDGGEEGAAPSHGRDGGVSLPDDPPVSVRPRVEGESEAEYSGRQERERIRRERRREHEQELRREAAGRKGKTARDADRDVSERIALGMPTGGARAGGAEALYDARLFNQAAKEGGGVGQATGGEDEYNAYDRPWRGGAGGDAAIAAAIYRPRARGEGVMADAQAAGEVEYLRQGAAKRFKGEGEAGGEGTDFEGVRRGGGAPPRSGPVAFDRVGGGGVGGGDDPFGMDALMGGGAGGRAGRGEGQGGYTR